MAGKGRPRTGDKKFREECREELIKCLNAYLVDEDKDNTYMVRFHRCYIGGDYGSIKDPQAGEKMYNMYRRQAQRNMKPQGYRNMALTTLRAFIIIEFYNREANLPTRELEDIMSQVLGDKKEEFIEHIVNNIKELGEE